MGDILSQNEIDDLLKALSSGSVDVQQISPKNAEKKIKDHDFRRPSKFAKDQMKSLQIIHESYGRLLQNYLSGYLRTLIQIEVISVEPMAYYEFNNSIANPAVLAIVELAPLTGNIIFEVSPNITFALMDRLLGGRGVPMDKMRSFTEVETVIVERLINSMLVLLKDPWASITSIRPRLEKIETNAQFAQIISPNEIIALITLNVKVGDSEGMINICIPHMVIEPVVSKLSTKIWFQVIEKDSNEETKKSLEMKIRNSYVPLIAILGNTKISVNEFLALSVGDVLTLDSSVDNPIDVQVGDMLKFHAKPGVRKNNVSIKITDVVKREEDE